MSSLKLKIEEPAPKITVETYHILRDFLQPSSRMTVVNAAKLVLDLLPEEGAESDIVWSFGETCIEVAEQIPWHHPSQFKPAAFFEEIGRFSKLGHLYQAEGIYHRSQRLGGSLRDNLNGTFCESRRDSVINPSRGVCSALIHILWIEPDPEDPGAYVNFHAFAANLFERRIIRTNPNWAIAAMREAHEESLEAKADVRDALVMAAAQWIFWYGQSLFKQVICPGDVSEIDLRQWRPGPLYDGKAELSLRRWHFWKDSFNNIDFAGSEKALGFGPECKDVAVKAAQLMESRELNMI
ncbi:MAG: hypothetical protein Q9191_000753 [Dirinaria sp. TL-2023a]